MTVSYSYEASTATVFTFWKLMAYWRGSIWKLVYKELILWLSIYLAVSLTFHYGLTTAEQKERLKNLVKFCRVHNSSTEVILMLGFFTTLAIGRFWEIYKCIDWPDNSALALATYLRSNEENERDIRLLRKTCARYLMVCFILILRDVSKSIRKRFPELKLLVNCNLLTEKEKIALEDSLKQFSSSTCKYWVPIEWMIILLKKHYIAGRNRGHPSTGSHFASHIDQYSYNDVIREILKYRSKLSDILSYDWVPIPLAYTQLCVMVVYIHSFMQVIVHQVVNDNPNIWEFFEPILFCTIQLLIMIGWIKSASVLLNPFGDDDDDIEVNWLVDRHWKTIFKMLDKPMINFPIQYPGISAPNLPHTFASKMLLQKKKPNPMVGSVAKMKVKKSDAQIMNSDYIIKNDFSTIIFNNSHPSPVTPCNNSQQQNHNTININNNNKNSNNNQHDFEIINKV